MLAMVLITPSFSLELVNRIWSSQTSFVGSPDGRQDLLLRNSFFFLQVEVNSSLVLERICGATHLLSYQKYYWQARQSNLSWNASDVYSWL